MRRCLPVIAALLGLPAAADETAPRGGQEILAAVQDLFDAIAARDGAALRELLLPQGDIVTYVAEGASGRIARRSHADFIAAIEAGDGTMLERMQDPVVHVSDGLASAWTPYEFFLNGELHHCGVNSLSFVRVDDAWRIASIVYSSRTDSCNAGDTR